MAPELLGGIGIGAASGLVNSIGSLLGIGVQNRYNQENMAYQTKLAKDLMSYQWNTYQSPKAQVAAMAQAGLNPVGMLGHGGSGAFSTPSPSLPTSHPVDVSGILDLSTLPNMINAVANAKKTGAEIPNIEAATANQIADTESKKLANQLTEKFGKQKWISDIQLAYQNALLANASTDKTKQETAYQELHNLWQKVINEQEGIKKDILVKERDNTDTRLGLENKLLEEKSKTEKSVQSSNYASAEASRAQAKYVNSQKVEQDFFNEVRLSDGVKDSFIKQFREFGNQAIRNGWLTYFEMESARHAVSQAAYADDMKEYTYWINQVNNVISTAAGAGAAFGALKHFNMLDKALGKPKTTTTENYNAFGEISGRSVSTTE